jgi:hypothetical protein
MMPLLVIPAALNSRMAGQAGIQFLLLMLFDKNQNQNGFPLDQPFGC